MFLFKISLNCSFYHIISPNFIFIGIIYKLGKRYERIFKRLDSLTESEISERRQQADTSFLEHGITFTVYGEEGGTERIFPFDPIPRVIPESEWSVVERGLRQRIIALNLFLNDIYLDGKIIKDGVIPEEIIRSSKNFRALESCNKRLSLFHSIW